MGVLLLGFRGHRMTARLNEKSEGVRKEKRLVRLGEIDGRVDRR
jgi:hypothetical protein